MQGVYRTKSVASLLGAATDGPFPDNGEPASASDGSVVDYVIPTNAVSAARPEDQITLYRSNI
jgi:hypothetical protein